MSTASAEFCDRPGWKAGEAAWGFVKRRSPLFRAVLVFQQHLGRTSCEVCCRCRRLYLAAARLVVRPSWRLQNLRSPEQSSLCNDRPHESEPPAGGGGQAWGRSSTRRSSREAQRSCRSASMYYTVQGVFEGMCCPTVIQHFCCTKPRCGRVQPHRWLSASADASFSSWTGLHLMTCSQLIPARSCVRIVQLEPSHCQRVPATHNSAASRARVHAEHEANS